MFLEFYGLKEQPFGVTPDPRFLYPSRTHSKAFYSLSSGIEANCGFLALIAKPGMGKTTLLFQLLKQFEDKSRVVFLSQTQCASRELLHFLLSALGLEVAGQGIVSMHEKLNQILARELLAGRRFLLVIDECQNFDTSVLETVRLLSNFETPRAKLMQIILAGQTELADKLARPGLAQLRQRISILSRLNPLTQEETVRYIEHRLQVAGYAGTPLFSTGALERIVASSEGIPRNINNLCFNAMLAGLAGNRRQINAATVDQVLADLELNSREPSRALPQPESPALSPTPGISETSANGLTPEELINALYPRRTRIKASKPIDVPDRSALADNFGASAAGIIHSGSKLSSVRPGLLRSDQNPKREGSDTTGESDVRFKVTARKQAAEITLRQAPSPKLESLLSLLSDARDEFLDREPAGSGSEASIVSDTAAISRAEKTSEVQRRDTRGPLSLPLRSSRRRKVAEMLVFGTALTMIGLSPFYSKVREHAQLEGPSTSLAAHAVTPPMASQGLKVPAAASTGASSPAEASLGLAPSSLTHTLGLKIARIVIDPGHGGEDTGTVGPTGLKEKDVCLDVALRLGHAIEQHLSGSEVIFTRTDDRFVPLEERANLANEKRADLFLSVHANSSSNHDSRGAETYYLNLRGSPEAMEVAARENAMAQETMSNLPELLKEIAGSEKIRDSKEFAENVQASLSRQISTAGIRMQGHGVRRAPFVVLTGVNMPSALAEISFLSNPFDEQLLRTDSYRQRLAVGLYQGLLSYLESLNSVTYDIRGRNRAAIPSRFRSGESKAIEQAHDHR
jgi:N-acetylmuramoyl-L-alanine amidase/type II secretory pathway predicted ATPase ExeA